jgi:hypothetical protein
MNKFDETEVLWPSLEEIGVSPHTAPVTLLREQASAIRDITNNIIEGQVIQETILKDIPKSKKAGDVTTTRPLLGNTNDPLKIFTEGITRETIEIYDRVKFSLFLRLPTFNGSRKRIISIEHDVSHLYPTIIGSISENHNQIEAKDEDTFKEILREIFHSEEMRAILQSFLAQSGYQQAA